MILAKTYKEGYPDKIRQRPLILWKTINTIINVPVETKTENSFGIAKIVIKKNTIVVGIMKNAKIAIKCPRMKIMKPRTANDENA